MIGGLDPNDFVKNLCNDSKCPLNRQGVPHDIHEKIENQLIINQCNDPRCAMNRMGLQHNKHDNKYETKSESKNIHDAETEHTPWNVNSDDDGVEEKQKSGTNPNTRSPTGAVWTGQWGEIPTPPRSQNDVPKHERMKAKQRDGEQKSHERTHESPLHQFEREQEPDQKHDAEDDAFEGTFDDALSELARQLHRGKSEKKPSATSQAEEMPSPPPPKQAEKRPPPPPKRDPILAATEPHDVFGIPKNSTYCDIKSRYRVLAREHDPSKGIINKSDGDKMLSNEIMTKINWAYTELKKEHRRRK